MKYLTSILNFLVSLSQNVRHYFKSGSFAIAVYPYLMHPCFKKMAMILTVIFGGLMAYAGVFYIFGEHVAILFSGRSITAYFHHSTLELFFPIGSVIDGKESTLSNLPHIMRILFSYQSYIVVPFYLICLYPISHKRLWLVELLLALLFAIGMALVSEITSGRYSEGGLQNFGLSLSIIIGNLMLLFIGLDLDKTLTPRLKKSSLWLGFIGLICVSITMVYPTLLSPILERISLYTIMIWEIIAGFAVMRNIIRHRQQEEDEDEIY